VSVYIFAVLGWFRSAVDCLAEREFGTTAAGMCNDHAALLAQAALSLH
jgi:hypothetical protein